MFSLLSSLGRTVADGLRRTFPDAPLPDVIPVERSDRADLQCTAALGLARAMRKNPREIAGEIAKALGGHPAVASCEVAGAGFVNITLSTAWLSENLREGLALPAVGAGQTVVVDYSSPNVAKPMHIGHIRSTILGEALKRVLRAVGYTVIADNHLGDWGTQFGKLIVAWNRFRDDAAFAREPVNELLRIYIRYGDEEKAQRAALGQKAPADDDADAPAGDAVPEILAAARAELVKLQQGDPANLALWQSFIDVSMKEFNRVYQRLGVSFDVTLGESFYNPVLADTVQKYLDAGVAEVDQGATIVTFSKERDGEAMPPLLVRKRDGGFLYGTTDLATIDHRVKTWSPSRILYVTDERQQLHFRQFFAAARRLGATVSLEHVWFGLMRLPEGTFSTRDGNVIGLEALLDEAERRARALGAEVATKSDAPFSDAELDEVARVVGLGAVKYNDLCKDRQTLVTFTWDKALALNGNSGPYLQYAYARMRSILRKAAAQDATPGAIALAEPSERALALALLRYPTAVAEVARSARPHILCDQLYEVAQAFSTFYAACPVLQSESAVRASRLALVALTADVLRAGLDLLGIETLERM
ncbi:MAG: arginine--tRNA ligase [Polyangiales bacterium]